MRQRLVKCFEGIAFLLLAFLAAGWSYFFYLIIVHGGIYCTEPNRVWLTCELILTIMVCFLGIVYFTRFLLNVKKDRRVMPSA